MSLHQINSQSLQSPSKHTLTSAWSKYWSSGAPHSCVGTYGYKYGGVIEAFWRQIFSAVQTGDRILDVATGNGALPRLLLEHSCIKDIQCDAVDIANIAPDWLSTAAVTGKSCLRFQGNIDAANLPFPDQYFDWIISQYGIEYSDLDLAIPEICRVAKAGGRVAIMAHHAQGRPVTLARTELNHLDWLLYPSGLFDTAIGLIEPMMRASIDTGRASLDNDLAAIQRREHYNALLDDLAGKASVSDGSEVLLEARDLSMSLLAEVSALGLSKANAQMAAARHAFESAKLRLIDLTTNALDESKARAISEILSRGINRSPRLEELHDQGHLMGWTIRLID